jgi:hypothetical protein
MNALVRERVRAGQRDQACCASKRMPPGALSIAPMRWWR